jgi:hypothetical protein
VTLAEMWVILLMAQLIAAQHKVILYRYICPPTASLLKWIKKHCCQLACRDML